jgi:hypothetical protein
MRSVDIADAKQALALSLSTNPDFIALIERSRARYKAGEGLSLDDVRLQFGLERKPRRKVAHKAARKSSRPRKRAVK